MFHRRVTSIFHYVLIGEQTQTFVLITTVFGFAIGNHFSWAWRFGWRHVAKQRGKWKIEWGLKLSDTTYLMIVFPHWFVQFSKFPISAIHGPRICSNRTLKYNTHHAMLTVQRLERQYNLSNALFSVKMPTSCTPSYINKQDNWIFMNNKNFFHCEMSFWRKGE